MDGLWSSNFSNWYTSWSGIHRTLVRGVSNVITTWSCDFDLSRYFQLSICSYQIWRRNELLEEWAIGHSSSGDGDVIVIMSRDFDELLYLQLWKSCSYEIWTRGKTFGEESIGYSYSDSSSLIIMWSRDFGKIFISSVMDSLGSFNLDDIWVQVFKNEPSKICGRQPLKNLKGYGSLKQTISL